MLHQGRHEQEPCVCLLPGQVGSLAPLESLASLPVLCRIFPQIRNQIFLYFSFFCPPSFLFFGCNMPFVLFLQSHHPRLTFGQHHSAFLPLEISSLVQVQSFPRMQSKVSCSFSGQLWSTQSPEGHKALSCGGLTPLV